MKNYLLFLSIFSILILGCVNIPGIGGPSIADITKLVPDKAEGYAIIQITKILQDEDFKKSIKESSGKDIESELQNVTKETGFDPRTFQTMLIFFKSSENSKVEPYMGIIVKGSFNKDLVASKIKEKQKFTEETYEGVQIYTTQDKYERTTSVAFLDQNTAVFGTKESVRDVIDVFKSKKQALNDPNINTVISKVNPNAMFLAAMRIPPATENPSGTDQILGKSNAVALAVDKNGVNVDAQAALNFIDSTSAEKAKETFDGFIKLAKGYTKSGSVSERLLTNVKLSSEGSVVILRLATTTKELEELGKELKSLQPEPIDDYNYPEYNYTESNYSDYYEYPENYEDYNYSDYEIPNQTE
ncbi:hypothetical protein HY570_00215 [Candidatus Micrarchaeota archaeon]|nr:hypothetical protein [Candidatus Micrarchaeota archaeon]